MRVMLRAQMDTRLGNEAVKDGTMPQAMQTLMERLKPEAAYFSPSHGKRSCTIVFDMQDSSQIPTIVEPLFTELGADVEIVPVMNLEDLQKGLAAL